jgi:uncharacterized repeat protein (TIGR01451 family)
VGVAGATRTLTAASTATTLTETLTLNYVMAPASCTGMSSGSPTVTTSAGTIAFSSANLGPGAATACTVTNDVAAPQVTLTNNSSVPNVDSAGDSVTYTLTVSNAGNVPLTSLTVTDTAGSVVCPTSSNTTIASLAVGASEACTISYAATQSDFDTNGGGDGDIDNAGTASTTYNSSPVTANGSVAVTLVITPQLTLLKTASTAGPVAKNNVITYTYKVTNSGNVTMTNIHIGDVHNGTGTAPVPGSESLFTDAGTTGDSTDTTSNGTWDTLAPGDVVTFTGNYTVTQADIDYRQ